MSFNAGDRVERRFGHGHSRFGRILGRCHQDYDVYYVNVGIGMTHIDAGRDLRIDARIGTDLPVFSVADHFAG